MNQASTKKAEAGPGRGLHYDTVRRLLIAGELPGYKAGPRLWRVSRAALDAYKAGGGARAAGRPAASEPIVQPFTESPASVNR